MYRQDCSSIIGYVAQASSLPDNGDLLKVMFVVAGAELEHLRMRVARLRGIAFDCSSEKLTWGADHLELELEESEAEAAADIVPAVTRAQDAARRIASAFSTTCRARTSCMMGHASAATAAAPCDA